MISPDTHSYVVVRRPFQHYNPASIALAENTCRELGESSSLGCVVVESCDVRWEAANEMDERMPVMRKLLGNEMRAAGDVSEEYGRPVILVRHHMSTLTIVNARPSTQCPCVAVG